MSSFFCPLKIEDPQSGNVIWSNPVPNSVFFCRPEILLRGKETYETVSRHFKPTLERLSDYKENNTITINNVEIIINIECSMIDGKMCSLLGGDGGAYCHYCTVRKDEANDVLRIQMGFVINRSVKEQKEIWDKLQTGEIKYNDPGRQGQTNPRMVDFEILFYGVLHSQLRCLDFCLKLLYHIVSG